MLGNDVFMTEEAFLNGWKASVLGAAHIGVAKPAVDLLHSRMDSVAERDGLLWPDSQARKAIHKIKHDGKDEASKEEQEETPPHGLSFYALLMIPLLVHCSRRFTG